ncbi:MAG: PEP-CTERM sorting domain-containing protein [Planctomycetes bacterium]|nr:PEP-CTERM sorting domain-containing protein [Planctomycetota bacterium]MBI3836101.1 PEP-CTERM sorting domain-containing protein [Planctomycetota bacterium]
MRKVAAVSLAVVAMVGSSAFAGIATFTPSPQPDVQQGTPTVTMELTVSAQQLQNFDGADLVLNSDVPFTFAYSGAFKTAANAFTLYADAPTNLVAGLPVGLGIRANDLYVSGAASTAGAFGSSIDVGTITLATAALPLGDYSIFISSDADGGTSSINRQGVTEFIEGTGSFTVVPEPASIGLMLIGAFGLLRRRIAG